MCMMTVVLFPMKTALHSRGTIVSNQCLSRRLTSTAVKSPITILSTVTVSVIFSALSHVLHIQYNITSAALDDVVCSTSRMLLKIHTFELVSRGSCHHRCSQVRDSDSPDLSAQERYSAAFWNLGEAFAAKRPSEWRGQSRADQRCISSSKLGNDRTSKPGCTASVTEPEHGNLQIPRRANVKCQCVSHRRIRLRG